MIQVEAEALVEIAAELDIASSWTSGAKASKLKALAARLRSHAAGAAESSPALDPPVTPAPVDLADFDPIPPPPDPPAAGGD